MLRRYSSLLAYLEDEQGQTFVEYALILVAITAIVLAGWSNLDTAINTALGNVINVLGA